MDNNVQGFLCFLNTFAHRIESTLSATELDWIFLCLLLRTVIALAHSNYLVRAIKLTTAERRQETGGKRGERQVQRPQEMKGESDRKIKRDKEWTKGRKEGERKRKDINK